MKKIFKWFWYKLGYLEKTDVVIRITGWRSCVYDNIFGQRHIATFLIGDKT